jgi:hypothetical protein
MDKVDSRTSNHMSHEIMVIYQRVDNLILQETNHQHRSKQSA